MDSEEALPIAIIGFTNATSPLEPAWPSTHRSLLPIAGKALIIYLIERLVDMGFRHVRIAGSIQQYAVSNRLGEGEEWGITIRYSDLHGPDLRTQTLMETGHCVYFNGDHLYSMDTSDWRPRGVPSQSDPTQANQTAGYWMLQEGVAKKYSLRKMCGGDYHFEPLETAADYHRVNLNAAIDSYSGLQIPGQWIKEGVSLDWDTTFGNGVHIGEQITIGKHCRIGKRVSLDSRCVVGNGAVLGADTHLSNVSVLPNVYVGAGTKLRDAIITPIGIFDLEGRFFPIEDASVIGRTRSNEESRTGIPSHRLSSIERRIRAGDDDVDFSQSHRLPGNVQTNVGGSSAATTLNENDPTLSEANG